MKKIGILTFHWADNFGAVLQAFALKDFIAEKDIDVEIIPYVSIDLASNYNIFSNPFRLIGDFGFSRGLKKIAGQIIFFPRNYKKRRKFRNFRNQFLKSSKDITKERLIMTAETTYSSIIVGSDQVWNPDFTDVDQIYMLNFNFSGLKFAYAASCAVTLDDKQLSVINSVIDNFDLVSIREKATIHQLSTSKEIYNVLDPVFLFSKDKWDNVLSSKKTKRPKEKYIFVYDLAKSKHIINVANHYSKNLGLNIISYSGSAEYLGKGQPSMGPLDFLRLIKHAELVITSSFHGLAFSIIYRKDFYVIKHPTRGSRMTELLEKFSLLDRQIDDEIPNFTKTQYSLCESRLLFEITQSKKFIDIMLKKNNANKDFYN